ncbi:MAG: hypothetical protein EOO17_01780 [Chloroflexi bacterium]|nr:MAG: hypothetical protein EOO17_01780 [Chloroflexota bacterium]
MREDRITKLIRFAADVAGFFSSLRQAGGLVGKNAPPVQRRPRRLLQLPAVDRMIPLSVTCSRPVVSLRNSISLVEEGRRALGRQYP